MKDRFRIGELARFFRISADLVRHYEDIGLVSPAELGKNGYRQYSFEDALKLNYVRVLRELGLGLDEIGDFVERRDLGGQRLMLEDYGRSIDKRIGELERLRLEVEIYEEGLDLALRLLGVFEIVESPRIVYRLSEDPEADLFMTGPKEVLLSSPYLHGPTYSMLIRKEAFEGGPFGPSLIPASSSVLKEGRGGGDLPPRAELFHAPRCLHSVFSSRTRIVESDLAPVRAHLKDQDLVVSGDSICAYLAFEKKGGGFVDYVEIWIPIEK
jgi:DNA-binding transcriptional MerR regulator